MTDRVPLEQVIDKEPEEVVEETPDLTAVGEEGIDEMQDLHELAVMMGFENGFDGNSPEFIYQWAKSYTGEPGGPKVLKHIADTIRLMGTTERGPMLMKKLNMYARLDSKQSELQMKKENLYV